MQGSFGGLPCIYVLLSKNGAETRRKGGQGNGTKARKEREVEK